MDLQSFVRWFRDSSPYIHAHRGRTFVVCFGGEAIGGSKFDTLAQDFALLNSLGIRLVLVHGIRPQIEARLKQRNIESKYKNGLRITDETAMQCVKEAAGTVRIEIEALMSMGLPDSPMANARACIASGNFVVAKPLGVIDGTDFCYTGEVRRVDAWAIRGKLDQNNIVLLSPIGYSFTGEIFNVSAEQVATSTAIAIKADKLILMMEQSDIRAHDKRQIRQMTTDEADQLVHRETAVPIDSSRHIQAAIKACKSGVGRAHLLSRKMDGALLLELFTRDGVGTLISSTPFELLRQASIKDITGIKKLLGPLEKNGVLIARSEKQLESEIDAFSVLEREGLIVGCAALRVFTENRMAELMCLVLHTAYQGEARGDRLLKHLETEATSMGSEKLFVLTTQSTHWFRERGFEPAKTQQLPTERQSIIDSRRNSKVLIKQLESR